MQVHSIQFVVFTSSILFESRDTNFYQSLYPIKFLKFEFFCKRCYVFRCAFAVRREKRSKKQLTVNPPKVALIFFVRCHPWISRSSFAYKTVRAVISLMPSNQEKYSCPNNNSKGTAFHLVRILLRP